MSDPRVTPDQIVDSAILLAEGSRWEAVRLYQVAEVLGISLADVHVHFREKEDLVEAWFDRADNMMLRAAQDTEFEALSSRERLQHLIMTWLDALAPHRPVTRQMILGKLEPGHLHIQIPGLLRISRTVQWIREAAHRDAVAVRRALEETTLTSIYVATFVYWMSDDSSGSQKTRRFLDRSLGAAERMDRLLFFRPGRRPSPFRTAAPESPVKEPPVKESLIAEAPLKESPLKDPNLKASPLKPAP